MRTEHCIAGIKYTPGAGVFDIRGMPSGVATKPGSGAHPMCALIPGFELPANGKAKGVVIAGMGAGGLGVVERVLGALPATEDGYEAPVYVVEPEGVGEQAWGERVRVFSGSDAVGAMLAECEARIDLVLPKHVIGDGSAAWVSEITAGLERLNDEQQRRVAAGRALLRALWAKRGMGFWRERYEQIRGGDAARVMVVTSRYSTYVKHSADDLAQAFGGLGHETHILMEPDRHALLTALHYVDRIRGFDPDLIIAINYPRSVFGDTLPEGWPYVCWVQDAMAHLFGGAKDSAAGSKGALDFLAGHVYTEAVANAGYAPEAVLEHPVCVSTTKFHAGAISTDRAARFACDIAYVSHRSETPEQFHERFMRISGFPAQAAPLLEKCKDAVEGVIERWEDEFGDAALLVAAEELGAGLGRAGDAAFGELLRHQYVAPLAEQLIRHQTLEWAARIAREEGLLLKIYGKGWENHPTLGVFAAGEVGHGDDLRACYQSAAVHLHASVLGCGHQRVYECALSGGVPLCRRSWGELYRHDCVMAKAFLDLGLPEDVGLVKWKEHAYQIANHIELMRVVRYRQRTRPIARFWDHEFLSGTYTHLRNNPKARYWDLGDVPECMRAVGILGDPLELTFSTIDELRERVVRGVKREAWRNEVGAGLAGRARKMVSGERFAERVLGLVGERLTGENCRG